MALAALVSASKGQSKDRRLTLHPEGGNPLGDDALSWADQLEFFQARDWAYEASVPVVAGAEHSAVVHQGLLATFGYGEHGRLGHDECGTLEMVLGQPVRRKDFCANANERLPKLVQEFHKTYVTNVACGFAHTLVLDREGHVYSMGNGTFGRLGHGDESDVWKPKRIEALIDEKPIVRIDAGYAHSIVCSGAGDAFTFGCGADGKLGHGDWEMALSPQLVQMMKERGIQVNSVYVGKDHSVVLSSFGIYTCGDGSCGQLGHGPDVLQSDTFRFVEAFRQLLVAHVSCGEEHTCVLTSKGYLYTFGCGGSGRLGHGDEENVFIPKPIPYFSYPPHLRKVIKSVAASTGHTMVLLVSGDVYAWGEGEGGQLGHGDFEDQYNPKLIEALQGIEIVAISSGNSHLLCMAWRGEGQNKRPVIYAFGEASFGQIGHGSPDDLEHPEESEVMAFRDDEIFWHPPDPPPKPIEVTPLV